METIVKEDNWRKDEKECIHKSNQQLTKKQKNENDSQIQKQKN